MSLFSRIFVIVTCLAIGALTASAAVLAWTIPVETIDWLGGAVDWLGEHNTETNKTVLAGIAGAIVLLALVVVVLELLPRRSTDVKVTDLKIGDAVLSTAAIGQRVEEAVHRVPHVASVRAAIKAKRKGVVVSLDLYVDPDANLAVVTDEACGAARDVLTNRVHVAMQAPPSVRLHYRELRLRARPSTRGGPMAPAATPVAPRSDTPADAPVALQTPIRQPADPAIAAPVALAPAALVAAPPPVSLPVTKEAPAQ